MQDIANRMARLQAVTAGFSALVESVQAHAPGAARGWDATHSVQVVIDAAGFPTDVAIDAEWEREIAPAALGAAVVTAYTAAVSEGMIAWSAALEEADWQSRAEQLGAPDPFASSTAPPAPTAVPTYAAPPAPAAADAPAPDLEALIEDAIATLHATRTRAAAPAAPLLGSAVGGGGRVTVRLSPAGLRGCEIDASWATGQQAETLVAAITGALRAARADLDRQVGASTAGASDVVGESPTGEDRLASGALVNDALAALAALTTVRDQQPEDAR